MEFMEKESENYYHGLGGIYNRANDVSKVWKIAKDFKAYNPEKMDSVSLYKLKKIISSGQIKSLDLLSWDERIPTYGLQYELSDYSLVYLASDKFPQNYMDWEDYRDWVAMSISFIVDIEKAKRAGVNIISKNLVMEEVAVKNQLSTEYIKAICIPVITKALINNWCQSNPFNNWCKINSFSLEQYLIERNNQVEIIRNILKENNLDIPIIESSTFAYIEDCFDFKDIIESQLDNSEYFESSYPHKVIHSKQYSLIRQQKIK